MDIGIGLPSTIPGTSAGQILQWAAAAEQHGFSSLGVIDRLVYGNDEPLVTLGAAAAVTQRITLMTSVLVAPLRTNAALLAKQAATVNHLSGGRFVLGMAVGGYEDDYAASGASFSDRGQRFDRMLDEMTRIWTPPMTICDRDNAEAFLTDHYAVEGPRVAERIAAAALTDGDAVRAAVGDYEQAGCDELLLFPCSADPQQVRLLAEAIG